jgi:antitoxin component YwqK of YwqJK toxin-antitoxin module
MNMNESNEKFSILVLGSSIGKDFFKSFPKESEFYTSNGPYHVSIFDDISSCSWREMDIITIFDNDKKKHWKYDSDIRKIKTQQSKTPLVKYLDKRDATKAQQTMIVILRKLTRDPNLLFLETSNTHITDPYETSPRFVERKSMEEYCIDEEEGTYGEKEVVLEKYYILPNGKKHGEYLSFHNDGEFLCKCTCNYKDGALEGEYTRFDHEGDIVFHTFYKKGQEHGQRMVWKKYSGKPRRIRKKVMLSKGKRHGQKFAYDVHFSGGARKLVEYDRGEAKYCEEYDYEGHIVKLYKSQRKFKDGKCLSYNQYSDELVVSIYDCGFEKERTVIEHAKEKNRLPKKESWSDM